MARTNDTLVKGILQGNYDADRGTDLTGFIASANAMVNRCQTMAAVKVPPRVLNDTGVNSEAELVERWLAAHFYCVNDPLYMQRTTEGASGGFQVGQAEKGFGTTEYGRTAVALDYSGCLENIGKKQRVGMLWLGLYPKDQTPYSQKS